MAGTSVQGILRALRGTAKPLYQASGVVEAPLPTIAELLARVTAGKVSKDNAFLLFNDTGDNITLSGGPDTFQMPYGTAEVDRARNAFSTKGNWWYKSEYTVEPHQKGALLVLRVYNAATKGRFLVALVQGGIAATVGPNLDAVLAKITRVFGFKTHREH